MTTIQATHPRVTGEQAQSPLPKTWYRAVDYIGPESNWEPRIALLIRGDGPLVYAAPAMQPLLFERLIDVADWGRAHALYIIGLEPRG